ncbi:hypothetical protein ACFWTE_21520 [Nocardiopsis sp. NPDC058631]|uniref:hypothetical protein n=1 Tax=Nocardiopsis sp. NPDC058631 TaxID=3346566 RepID=UPI00365FB7A0
MSETGGELGVALGIATLGTLGAAVYRSQVQVPDSVPAEAAESSRESIANATVEAVSLPAQVGADLLENAREAFSTGLGVTAAAAVVLYVLLAVLAFATLRGTPPTGAAEADGSTGPDADRATGGAASVHEPVSVDPYTSSV